MTRALGCVLGRALRPLPLTLVVVWIYLAWYAVRVHALVTGDIALVGGIP
jgi:hypothetical protein